MTPTSQCQSATPREIFEVGTGSFRESSPRGVGTGVPRPGLLGPHPAAPATPASPGAVGVLADEQRLSGAADGAVGLVPVVVIQEEAIQERVLGRRRSRPVPPAPAGPPRSHPHLPAYLARGAHPPLKQRVLCVHLETATADAQVWGDKAQHASPHRPTQRTELTRGAQDPGTEKHAPSLKEIGGDLSKWEGVPRSRMRKLLASPAGPETHTLSLKCTRKCKESVEKVSLWSPDVGRGGTVKNGFGGFREEMKMSSD